MDILLILFLILLNGIFALSEMAIISSRKARLHQWAEEGKIGAKVAVKLADNPSHFLSTIQVGITSIGILSGALGESAIADGLAEYFKQFSSLQAYSDTLSTIITVLLITYLSLILGELVPKRLALQHAEEFASIVSRPMRWLSLLAYPLVRVLSFSTETILRLLRIKPKGEDPITEEEIQVLIAQGTEAGIFEKAEQRLVSNVFRLDDQKIAAIMTPRLDIVLVDLQDSLDENRRKLLENEHSRLPVCQSGLENILGIVQTKHLLSHVLSGESFEQLDFKRISKNPLYVPETITSMQLLETFRKTASQMALVVNEYGDIQGLVTLNDVLVSIVGELPKAEADDEMNPKQREDGSWLIDGMYPIEKFKEHFKISQLEGENTGYFHTVAGFVMWRLGKVPEATDTCEWGNFKFEVVDMDGKRIDKVLIVVLNSIVEKTVS